MSANPCPHAQLPDSGFSSNKHNHYSHDTQAVLMKYDTDPCKETSDADSYAGYARNT